MMGEVSFHEWDLAVIPARGRASVRWPARGRPMWPGARHRRDGMNRGMTSGKGAGSSKPTKGLLNARTSYKLAATGEGRDMAGVAGGLNRGCEF